MLMQMGRHSEAEPLLWRVYKGNVQRFGPMDKKTLKSANDVVLSLIPQGSIDSAEPLMRSLVAANEETYGIDDSRTLSSINALAMALSRRAEGVKSGDDGDAVHKDLAEAEILLRRVLRANSSKFGPDDSRIVQVSYNLAKVLAQGNRREQLNEAEDLLRRALTANEASGLKPADVRMLNVFHSLGDVLTSQTRFENQITNQLVSGKGPEAVLMLRRAAEGRALKLGKNHRDTKLSEARLATARELGELGVADEG